MRLCRHFVGVEFGRHDGDEVLEHVVSWGNSATHLCQCAMSTIKLKNCKSKRTRHRFTTDYGQEEKLTFCRDFLCAVQRADEPRDRFSKGQMVDPVGEVVGCNTESTQESLSNDYWECSCAWHKCNSTLNHLKNLSHQPHLSDCRYERKNLNFNLQHMNKVRFY